MISAVGAGDAFFGTLIARLQAMEWDADDPRLADALADAAEAGARATESWGAPGVDRARVRRIRDRLREVYGKPAAPPHRTGLDELVLTVLSQSTNDRNRDVAFLRLRGASRAGRQVRDAPNEEVEEAIRPGGISKVKSQRIQDILRALPEPLDWAAPARSARLPALAARRRAQDGRLRAAVLLRAARRSRSTRTSGASARRLGLFRAEGAVRGDARRDARDHAARPGAGVPREPAPPRPPHMPRRAPACGSAPFCGCARRRAIICVTPTEILVRSQYTTWARPSASTSARRTRAWPCSRAASRPSSRTPRAAARPRRSSRSPKSGERLVGTVAKRQAVTNPENTVFSIKRFMGRKEAEVQRGGVDRPLQGRLRPRRRRARRGRRQAVLAAGDQRDDPPEAQGRRRGLPRRDRRRRGHHRPGVLQRRPAPGHQGRRQDRRPRRQAHHQRADRRLAGLRPRQGVRPDDPRLRPRRRHVRRVGARDRRRRVRGQVDRR